MTTTIFCPFSIKEKSRQTDSNRRPADYKSAALPTELCRHFPRKIAVNLSSASVFLHDFSIRTAPFSSRSELDKVLDVIVCQRNRFFSQGLTVEGQLTCASSIW